MADNFMPSAAEMIRFLPETILILVGTLIMILEPLTAEGSKSRLGWLSIFGLLAAGWAAVVAHSNPGPAFQAMLIVDGFATFFRLLVIGVGVLTILASFGYLRRERHEGGEYYALVLFSISGQCVMVTANELIMLFIGLEISSIASYVLAGYLRDDKRNNESALKYFLLGSFATAFLLYGVAWIYGATGTTNLSEIQRVLSNRDLAPAVGLVGTSAALIFVGLAFKVSAAPFQVWAPDVYQGAPAPVSAFLSAGPKAAAFAVFLRVFLTAFEPIADKWQPVIWISALATMIIGNFAALLQSNIKRLLAYSSIAHAGYVMVAIDANSQVGTTAVMFYMASYAFMNIGAFAVITEFSRKGERFVSVDDMAGLGQRQPVTAALLSIFLLSLIGVPLTGGFFGKFYIFKAALDANLVWLTVLGLLNSAVAAYYYLRIIVVMYFKEPGDSMVDLPPLAPGVQAVLWGSALATLVLGIYPSIILRPGGGVFKKKSVDPEGLRFDATRNKIYWTSEGRRGLFSFDNPAVSEMHPDGSHSRSFAVPSYYFPRGSELGIFPGNTGIHNNLAFESLAISTDGATLYAATENGLIQDSPPANAFTGSRARILAFDIASGRSGEEYIYEVEPVAEAPALLGPFATNGLTDFITVGDRQFITIERSFTPDAVIPGKATGCTVRLYYADARGATNVAGMESIANRRIVPVRKILLLDLSDLKNMDGSALKVGNIEGITFGPDFHEKRTLILVADNNFSIHQLMQFIALELNTGPRLLPTINRAY